MSNLKKRKAQLRRLVAAKGLEAPCPSCGFPGVRPLFVVKDGASPCQTCVERSEQHYPDQPTRFIGGTLPTGLDDAGGDDDAA